MISLSKDQLAAVDAGITPKENSWTPFNWSTHNSLPLPEWLLDLDVDWMERYANRPKIHVKVLPDSHDWPGKVWDFEEPNLYIARSEDGRATAHYHGPFSWNEELQAYTTKQSEGYGGRHFHIKMRNGNDVILRGPWHGLAPDGYEEVTTHDMRYPPYTPQNDGRPEWVHSLGCFGLNLSEQLIASAIRQCPNLDLAWVTQYGRTHLEPRKAAHPPKNMTFEEKKEEEK